MEQSRIAPYEGKSDAMRCFYINLDSATGRRDAIERNFQAVASPGWTLTRYPAKDVAFVEASTISGRLAPAEKACFASHRELIRHTLPEDGHVMILEDDVLFGVHTCDALDSQILNSQHLAHWDIIFTDVAITGMAEMFELVRMRNQADAVKLSLFDLRNIPFAGSAAYIVNSHSKHKIYDLLCKPSLDVPYDLYLKMLISEGKLRAMAVFPFATTVSSHALESQIQSDSHVLSSTVLNLFREMIWMERDVTKHQQALEEITRRFCDEKSRGFGILWEAMASRNFRM